MPNDKQRPNQESASTGSLLEKVTASITLGHLCFLPIWDLIIGGSPRLFHLDESLATVCLAPLSFLTITISLIGFICLHRLSKTFRTTYRIIWISLVVWGTFSLIRIFIYGYLNKFHLVASFAFIKILVMFIGITLLCVTALFCSLQNWVNYSRRTILIISPFVLFIWGQVGYYLYTKPQSKPIRLQINSSNPGSTIWILLFDELDGHSVLEKPNQENVLSEFHFWKTFSFFGTNAYPPARATLWSIPALTQGYRIANCPSDMNYINNAETLFKSGKDKNWDWSDNIFSDIAQKNGRSEVIGWGEFPYHALYQGSVTKLWVLTEKLQSDPTHGIPSFIALLRAMLFESTVAPLKAARLSRGEAHGRLLNNIHSILTEITNKDLPKLVWIHYPIPHYPAIKKGGSYSDNLISVNNELKFFRELLQNKGLWDDSTIFIMSDHWFRKPTKGLPKDYIDFTRGFENRWSVSDHRVPFFLKLPHQTTGFIHRAGFNTIVFRKLLKEIQTGEAATPTSVSTWLDAHTPYAESPDTLTDP